MNRTRVNTRHNPWVEGSLASWMGGVTLGVVLGAALLIVTPKLMTNPDETAKAPTAAEQSTNASPGGSATAGSQEEAGGSQEAAGGTTATTNAPTTETPAAEQDTGGTLPAAQSPAVAANTTGDPAQQDTNGMAESVAAGGKADAAPTPNAAEGDAAAGTEIFAGNCAGCHGAQGAGGIGPSLVTDEGPKGWTLAQFTTVLREGKLPEGRELSAVMPRFTDAQLSDTQVADVLAHIKTLN
ncbi:c-type cytochrome [Deinococcus arenicola]|uniref:C-type cytochrome n=1 Tax=Deinococcus arenicola TaxID=2994950 RepID=A0ABU4DKN9_9DEIO|nr:c-type cytochrome [Deinococcus sp. ZS9-10]MDV6372998.1 c-type cytochrome [Deinococcus sp. ZS9-10]